MVEGGPSPPPPPPHALASGSLWLPRPEARGLYMCHEAMAAPWRRARGIGCVSLRVTGESRRLRDTPRCLRCPRVCRRCVAGSGNTLVPCWRPDACVAAVVCFIMSCAAWWQHPVSALCRGAGRGSESLGLGGGQTTRGSGQCHFHILLTFPPSMLGHTFTNTNNVYMSSAESTLA